MLQTATLSGAICWQRSANRKNKNFVEKATIQRMKILVRICARPRNVKKYLNSMESHVEHQKHSWITKTWRERKMLKIQNIFSRFSRSSLTVDRLWRMLMPGEWERNGTKVSWTVKIVLKLIQIAIAQFFHSFHTGSECELFGSVRSEEKKKLCVNFTLCWQCVTHFTSQNHLRSVRGHRSHRNKHQWNSEIAFSTRHTWCRRQKPRKSPHTNFKIRPSWWMEKSEIF